MQVDRRANKREVKLSQKDTIVSNREISKDTV